MAFLLAFRCEPIIRHMIDHSCDNATPLGRTLILPSEKRPQMSGEGARICYVLGLCAWIVGLDSPSTKKLRGNSPLKGVDSVRLAPT